MIEIDWICRTYVRDRRWNHVPRLGSHFIEMFAGGWWRIP